MSQRRSALLITVVALCGTGISVCAAVDAPRTEIRQEYLLHTSAQALRGGSTETLTMAVERLPRGAEEWEAFLSLDGGAHYTIRITPHLDLALRRVTWVVPNVDAREARIMVRAGDERQETSFELPTTFAIARDPSAPLPPTRSAPITHAEEGVVAWAEGDRAGTRMVLATNVPPPRGVTAIRNGEAADEAPFDAQKKSRAAAAETSAYRKPATRRTTDVPTSRHPNRNILLLSRRLNV